jgi:uncharacterized repeat protein (TIGR03803 family)
MPRQGIHNAVVLVAAALVSAPPGSAAVVQADSVVSVVHEFPLSEGAFPIDAPVEGPDGMLYGVTNSGGQYQKGTVFRSTRSGAVTTLFSFGAVADNLIKDGFYPATGLTVGPDGQLYGTTSQGGFIGDPMFGGSGSVFRISTQGGLQTILTFNCSLGCQPFGRLILSPDNDFYGTTLTTLFRMATNGVMTVLHEFATDASDGGNILSGLVEGPDGWFYGSASVGGFGAYPGAGGGTIFAVKRDGTFRLLHVFPSGQGEPGSLTFGPDGALYGVLGAATGAVFRITTTGDFTSLAPFGCSCATPEGAFPIHGLTLATDGYFYGTTAGGGEHNKGTIYRISLTGEIVWLHSFSDLDGGSPSGGLIEAGDGRLYGYRQGDYSKNSGTIYSVIPSPPAPAGLTAAPGSTRVDLIWNAVGSADSYDVYMGTSPDALAAAAGAANLSKARASITGLATGTTYYFAVTARNEGGQSERSNAITATTSVAGASSGGGGAVQLPLLLLLGLCVGVQWIRRRTPG